MFMSLRPAVVNSLELAIRKAEKNPILSDKIVGTLQEKHGGHISPIALSNSSAIPSAMYILTALVEDPQTGML